MSDPVTVPADLLPGLLRPNVDVMCGCGSHHVFMFEHKPGYCLLADEKGIYRDEPIEGLELVISVPVGWDAAVDALARRLWPFMEAHERATFSFDGGVWRLDPPRRILEARRGAWQGWGWSDDMPPPWEPHEALRRVLHHVAGSPL